ALRCVLLTSRPTTDLNACGCEGSPVRVTNSISQRSYRTSRPWRSIPPGHPLRPGSRTRCENSQGGSSDRHRQNRLPNLNPSAIQGNHPKRLFRQHRPMADKWRSKKFVPCSTCVQARSSYAARVYRAEPSLSDSPEVPCPSRSPSGISTSALSLLATIPLFQI